MSAAAALEACGGVAASLLGPTSSIKVVQGEGKAAVLTADVAVIVDAAADCSRAAQAVCARLLLDACAGQEKEVGSVRPLLTEVLKESCKTNDCISLYVCCVGFVVCVAFVVCVVFVSLSSVVPFPSSGLHYTGGAGSGCD